MLVSVSALLSTLPMSIILSLDSQALKERFFDLRTPEDVAILLEIDPNKLRYNLYGLPNEKKYTRFYISKKFGGTREIVAPNRDLKLIQQKLNQVLQSVYRSKDVAHGFITNKSIVTNAQTHARVRPKYILNLDLDNFFPAINFGRVRGMFIAMPYHLPCKVATVLAQICCFDGKLPQGAPTSPIISNMICSKMDGALDSFAYDHRCLYTRYADDITFSTTSKASFSTALVEYDSLGNIIIGSMLRQVIEENGFTINNKKVRLQDNRSRQEVTGLIINSQAPNIKRKFVRQIRAMLHAWDKYGVDAARQEFLDKYDNKRRSPWNLPPAFQNVVRGKIEFVGMVRGHSDELYTKLLTRFHELAKRDIPLIEKQTQPTGLPLQNNVIEYESISVQPSEVATTNRDTSLPFGPSINSGRVPNSIELLLSERTDNEFEVHVLSPGEALARARVPAPYTQEELIAILKVLRYRSLEEAELKQSQLESLTRLGLLVAGKPVPDLPDKVGSRLFEALLPGDIGNFLKHVLHQVRKPKVPIGLKLKFYPEDVYLTRYPWELVNYRQPLLLNSVLNLTRYIQDAHSDRNLIPVKTLNLLYIESRPQDKELDNLPVGDSNRECNAIRTALETLEASGSLSFQKLESASYQQLHQYLANHSVNVLHFDGHGRVARICPSCHAPNYPHHSTCQTEGCGYSISHVEPLGYLAFQDAKDTRLVDWVDSKELGLLLANHDLSLAVLSACQSGEVRGKSIFGSVGPSLIQAGVPAVVAMQLPVTLDSSETFMQGFYTALARSETLPEAIRQGRLGLLRNPEWFIPIIYWRSNADQVPFLKVQSKQGG